MRREELTCPPAERVFVLETRWGALMEYALRSIETGDMVADQLKYLYHNREMMGKHMRFRRHRPDLSMFKGKSVKTASMSTYSRWIRFV